MKNFNNKETANELFTKEIEVVSEAASSQQDRAEFIKDPLSYAKTRGVYLDGKFADIIKDELVLLERYAAVLGCNNPYLAENGVLLTPVMRRKGVSTHSHPGAAPVAVLAAVSARVMRRPWKPSLAATVKGGGSTSVMSLPLTVATSTTASPSVALATM